MTVSLRQDESIYTYKKNRSDKKKQENYQMNLVNKQEISTNTLRDELYAA